MTVATPIFHSRLAFLVIAGTGLLAGCGGYGNSGDTAVPLQGQTQVWRIEPGPEAERRATEAFIAALPGDVIEFACGRFDMDTGFNLRDTEGVTIQGCGRDSGLGEDFEYSSEATILNFSDSDVSEGILVSHVKGLTIQNLTVEDTPGDAIKVTDSRFVIFRNVGVRWSDSNPSSAGYQPSEANGAYGLYPVLSEHVLIEGSEAIGASDAGIYVGQSTDVIVRNSRAAYNVAGFEIENTDRADMHDNLAEFNTGGFLVFDLPGLSRFGDSTRVFNNISRENNTDNFAPAGNIVGAVPRGTGMLLLAYDQIEVFGNEIRDHDTASVIIVSYEMISPNEGDLRYDFYPEAIHIHDNLMENAGHQPPLPDLQKIIASGGSDVNSVLPLLVAVKNGGTGGHVLWDGLYDDLNDCPAPEGVPQNARGEPQYRHGDELACRYNAYKFDDAGQRIQPDHWLCIENNTASNAIAPFFANFHGLEPLDALLFGDVTDPAQIASLITDAQDLPADRDVTPYVCTLPPLPAVELESYEPSEDARDRLTNEEILAICEGGDGQGINREALAVDCPRLDHYNLFADPEDPTANANDGGTRFELTTQLFSDYAVKYRFAFLPPDEAAQWRTGEGNGANATVDFPIGTVISKTFVFPSSGNEDVVETRLLIHRTDEDSEGGHWVGRAYVWETEEDGSRVARLALGGDRASVIWNYNDPHTGDTYQGATDSYLIPNANQCDQCHANDDRPAGAAPIGPKPRYLNQPFDYPEQGAQNQLSYWQNNGLLAGAPVFEVDDSLIATNAPRMPIFNVVGDSGQSGEPDIEARMRAYLEVNCAHCHNPKGAARNSGMFLDSLRVVNRIYGICKQPVAAGQGSGGLDHDIVPTDADESIVHFRMNSNEPDVKMPEIGRSVIHDEAVALVKDWIDNVVDGDYEDAGCEGGLLP